MFCLQYGDRHEICIDIHVCIFKTLQVPVPNISMVSCQKGPTRHAHAWQIGPFWQDTLDIRDPSMVTTVSADDIAGTCCLQTSVDINDLEYIIQDGRRDRAKSRGTQSCYYEATNVMLSLTVALTWVWHDNFLLFIYHCELQTRHMPLWYLMQTITFIINVYLSSTKSLYQMWRCQFSPQSQYATHRYLYRKTNWPVLWLHAPPHIIARPSAGLNTENKNISMKYELIHTSWFQRMQNTLNLLMIIKLICWIGSCYFFHIYIIFCHLWC